MPNVPFVVAVGASGVRDRGSFGFVTHHLLLSEEYWQRS
jgi:hypothetical protein